MYLGDACEEKLAQCVAVGGVGDEGPLVVQECEVERLDDALFRCGLSGFLVV